MQENNCKYVCSRGIIKSCDIYSQQPISSIRQVIRYDFSICKNGSTLYICNSALKHFVSFLFPRLHCKIILVTGDCDETCWEDLFSTYKEFISFIENEKNNSLVFAKLYCKTFKNNSNTNRIRLSYNGKWSSIMGSDIKSCRTRNCITKYYW